MTASGPPRDPDRFARIERELFTAVVGDVMDAAGLTSQFLPPNVRPIRRDMVVLGRAMPLLEADCADTTVAHENRRRPFGLMMEALDDLRPGEVYVCTGSSSDYALWGGLMTTRAMRLRAAGAVVDGHSRDTRELSRLPFPVFSHGPYAQDQGVRGRVVDFRCPIRFRNGTIVRPGDLLFGDVDGVLVIPREDEDEILQAAFAKASGENSVRHAIEAGMSARQAFDTFGIM